MRPILFLLPAALAIGIAMPAQADTVYKWVDQNGVTNYTTTPPQPTNARTVATINAAPAVESRYEAAPGSEEARYWRQRREREAADSLRNDRLHKDSLEQQEWRTRQELALRYDEDLRRDAANRRRQAAFDQCMFDRLPNCSSVDGGGYGYAPAGVVVAGRRPGSIYSAAGFPVPGSLFVTNPTPGAPSLSTFNPTPGAFLLGTVPTRTVQRRTVAARLH
jgi:hypothetical protein